MEPAEDVCKVLVLGSSRVGKTSILSRFLHGHFPGRHRATTRDCFRERVAINLSLEIEELGSQFAGDHVDIVQSSIISADVIIVVIALDDIDCVNQATRLKNTVSQTKGNSDCVIIVGNKIDLAERSDEKVSLDEFGSNVIECSARKNINVTNIFKACLEKYFSLKNSSDPIRVSRQENQQKVKRENIKTQRSFEMFEFWKNKMNRKRITSTLSSNGSQEISRKNLFTTKSLF